jgi:hypothetical protein
MLVCARCKMRFEPGDADQAVCDNCRDEDSIAADMARMAAQCEPLSPEEADRLQMRQDQCDMEEELDVCEKRWSKKEAERGSSIS